jgi:hypothetical protein
VLHDPPVVSGCLLFRSCRCIDKAGGLDLYLLRTPDKKMGSDIGARLRQEVLDELARRRREAAAGASAGPAQSAIAAAASVLG